MLLCCGPLRDSGGEGLAWLARPPSLWMLLYKRQAIERPDGTFDAHALIHIVAIFTRNMNRKGAGNFVYDPLAYHSDFYDGIRERRNPQGESAIVPIHCCYLADVFEMRDMGVERERLKGVDRGGPCHQRLEHVLVPDCVPIGMAVREGRSDCCGIKGDSLHRDRIDGSAVYHHPCEVKARAFLPHLHDTWQLKGPQSMRLVLHCAVVVRRAVAVWDEQIDVLATFLQRRNTGAPNKIYLILRG